MVYLFMFFIFHTHLFIKRRLSLASNPRAVVQCPPSCGVVLGSVDDTRFSDRPTVFFHISFILTLNTHLVYLALITNY